MVEGRLPAFHPALIQPVRQFHDQCSISGSPVARKIIVGVHNEKIRHRGVTPLETHVDVHIFNLLIVLDKGRQKYLIRKRHVQFRAKQPKVCFFERCGQANFIVAHVHGKVDVGLDAVPDHRFHQINVAIVKRPFTVQGRPFKRLPVIRQIFSPKLGEIIFASCRQKVLTHPRRIEIMLKLNKEIFYSGKGCHLSMSK